MIHVLLICSLILAPVLKLIPKTVLYGVFLFMGVGALAGVQLYDRCARWFIWETDK
jgi:MFS superfamily sulfate permease-like transporter